MSTFHSSLAMLLLLAACDEERPARKERELDATTFRQMLQCGAPTAAAGSACDHLRNEVSRIESIRIEPRGPTSARYVITWRDRGTPDVTHAEFPGKITDEITAAGISYSVK